MTDSNARTRRSPEQRIADLQAQIDAIKQRAERAKAKRDPSLHHIAKAQKSVEAAMAETDDGATRQALQEVHATLAATLALNGVVVAHAAAPRARRVSAEDLGVVSRIFRTLLESVAIDGAGWLKLLESFRFAD